MVTIVVPLEFAFSPVFFLLPVISLLIAIQAFRQEKVIAGVIGILLTVIGAIITLIGSIGSSYL